MKMILSLVFLVSLSLNALASDKIESAKETVMRAVSKSFVIYGNTEILRISLESMDIESLQCSENEGREVLCSIHFKKSEVSQENSTQLLLVIDQGSGLITQIDVK